MSAKPLLFFDSGIGGLTVLKEVRALLPTLQFIYVADDAGFPYGLWEEKLLRSRILKIFTYLMKCYDPALCVIACNTASTLVISDLRHEFPHIPFVGTVPAIKLAAELTKSGLISVLATPGTVKRAYTHELICAFANQCCVQLVGSEKLAIFSENYLRGYPIDLEEFRNEILPCFVEKNGKYTDVIVLACTHYPFLMNLFREQALWPVNWIDPARAIARRTRSLLPEKLQHKNTEHKNYALFTSKNVDLLTEHLLQRFNLSIIRGVDFKI
ncbi:glutamate racemase [Bartonella ancashensis]|uniref:Glutamate racemase n=1 Tax=Bartonella ancashensis TaxID=1318743 RepID=A0A0M5KX34_9HYPH|nr:glutamate racemase [Bartonella ancashensis]ALE03773.1 Glutamate racemase [Bartonella ancashensis]